MSQLQLFRRNDPHTSRDAAASVNASIARQESMIWSVLCDFGPMNAEGIAREISRQYVWKCNSVAVCRRFKAMEGRLIEYAGYTLPQASGRRARAMQAISQPDARAAA